MNVRIRCSVVEDWHRLFGPVLPELYSGYSLSGEVLTHLLCSNDINCLPYFSAIPCEVGEMQKCVGVTWRNHVIMHFHSFSLGISILYLYLSNPKSNESCRRFTKDNIDFWSELKNSLRMHFSCIAKKYKWKRNVRVGKNRWKHTIKSYCPWFTIIQMKIRTWEAFL